MKKLICLLVTISLLAISGPLMAIEEGGKCVLKKDSIIGIVLITGQVAPAMMVKPTPITVTKITKDVPHPDIPNLKYDMGEFSLSYDKPDFYCRIHGVDSYDTYKKNLGSDIGVFLMEFCEWL